MTTQTYDLMDQPLNRRNEMPPHGFVEFVDMMPRVVPVGETADHAILRAARVSTGADSKGDAADRGLIRYLVRHRHTTPIEMVELQFRVRMPIFVARQWIRHRTASVNEESGRYKELDADFWMPTPIPDRQNGYEWRGQASTNRQASSGDIEYTPYGFNDVCDDYMGIAEEVAVSEYHLRLQAGVSREMARTCLPLSTYTSFYWKIDLHNFLHFISLRMHSHAQPEIQVYARAMFEMVQPMAPWACEAFLDFHPHMGGMNLSRQEIEAMGELLRAVPGADSLLLNAATATSGEQREWQSKWDRIVGSGVDHVG